MVFCIFFFQTEDGIRFWSVTGVQTCALPILGVTSCSSVNMNDRRGSTVRTITIEAELGFQNTGDQQFSVESNSFYSKAAAIKLPGNASVGASGTVEYSLDGIVSPGVYIVTVYYNDENDGHSPVQLRINSQSFDFEMAANTPSAFAAAENQRQTSFSNVVVKPSDVLSIQGWVHRYNSEHKELVRLDKITFTKQN